MCWFVFGCGCDVVLEMGRRGWADSAKEEVKVGKMWVIKMIACGTDEMHEQSYAK